MGCPGFEPGTSRLKAECSTTELATPAARFERANVNIAQIRGNLAINSMLSLGRSHLRLEFDDRV